MPKSPLYRNTTAYARKHSRVSMIAASAATVGALGAVGFAAGAEPWTAALDNVSHSVDNGSQLTAAGQHTDLFKTITGAVSSKSAAGAQLDTIRSGATAGSTAAPVAKQQPAKHAAVAVKQEPAKQQAVKAAPAKQQPAKHAAKAAPAKPKAAAKPKAKAAPAKQYLIYDSVTPSSIPAGQIAGVYVNGAYAASYRQTIGHQALWIDVNGSNPGAKVLDVEPGDATPASAAVWVQQRLNKYPHDVAIVYTMRSQWQAVKHHVAHLPAWMQSKVRYWIADPTGVPHVVPGSNATQWYWGPHYDITTANPEFTH